MKYNFIEIGTSDFETLIENTTNEFGLSIDAVDLYLDKLPNKPNVTKLNCGISNKSGHCEVFYVDPSDIEKYNLPWYLKGCNSIDKPHKVTQRELEKNGLTHLLKSKKIPLLTWQELVESYNVDEVEFLKIDAEGHDYIIVQNLLEFSNVFPETIIFESNELTSEEDRVKTIELAQQKGYTFVEYDYKKNVILKLNRPKKRAALVEVWMGKLPDYFQYHLETIKYVNQIDFYFFTNDRTFDFSKFTIPHFHLNFIEEDELLKLINEISDIKIEKIENKRKIIDFKLLYFKMFYKFLSKYEFIGIYDIDTLFGDINDILKISFQDYDFISVGDNHYHKRLGGPFLLIRNKKEILNHIYNINYYETLIHDGIYGYAERQLSEIAFKNYEVKLITETNTDEQNGGKIFYDVCWSGGKLTSHGKEIKFYHFYRKNKTIFNKVGNKIFAKYDKNLFEDFYWATCFTENYSESIMGLLNSLHKFSNRKCILYCLNFDYQLPETYQNSEQIILRRYNVQEGPKDHKGRDFNVMNCKPEVWKDAARTFNDKKIVFIDSDISFTTNSDDITKFFPNLENYPLINSHVHDVIYTSKVILEEPWTNTLRVLLKEMGYENNDAIFPRRKTNIIIFDSKSEWFFDEQLEIFERYKSSSVPGILGLHDEDTANALLTKYNLQKCLPLLDIEQTFDLTLEKIHDYSYNMTNISAHVVLPKDMNEILFFHGQKKESDYVKVIENYGTSVLDCEEIYCTYYNNTLFFERNSFLTTKKNLDLVDFVVKNEKGEEVFKLKNQKILNYWIFYISNFYLTPGNYKIEIYSKTNGLKIYNDFIKI